MVALVRLSFTEPSDAFTKFITNPNPPTEVTFTNNLSSSSTSVINWYVTLAWVTPTVQSSVRFPWNTMFDPTSNSSS